MENDINIPQIKPVQSILEPPKLEVVSDAEAGSNVKEQVEPPKQSFFKRIKFPRLGLPGLGSSGGRTKKILVGSLGSLLLVALIILVLVVLPAVDVYKKGKTLEVSARALKDSVNSQDINVVKNKLSDFKKDFLSFQKSYKRLTWTKPLPVIGNYYKDGEAGLKAGVYGIEAGELTLETVTPFADIIGFAGPDSQQSESGEDTANDRIDFLVQSLDVFIPKMDELTQKVSLAQAELAIIDPNRYPEHVKGKPVRSTLKKYLTLADEGAEFVKNAKPLMEATPYLIGLDDTRTYLLLFQNDKELRPTGGFLTAYSFVEVTGAKLNPTSSNDIYNLDGNYKATIDAPEPFIKFVKEPYRRFPQLRLRDMNWSPDFRVSMEQFLEEAESVGVKDIDGVIAVDTQVVVNILKAIGQVGVFGFGNFNADTDPRCNCPQVVYELESFADVEGAIVWSENEPGKIVFAPPNYENRKKIVGPLMNSVLANALGQPKDKIPALFEAAWKTVTEKHVLLYVYDEEAQRGIEAFGIGGRIVDTDGDFLHVNDANLAGRKSNLYVTQEVSQDIEISKDGSVVKTLTLTYKNPAPYDGWLNSVLPNWTRVYVPKGSELIDSQGFDQAAIVEEDLGKTVFAGSFSLRPEGVQKITLTYKLPFKVEDKYKIFIQKQPGTDTPLHTIKVGKQLEELFLRTDKSFTFHL